MHVDNLISGSSAFLKSSFDIRKFSVHVLLKPSLKDFEHYSALPSFGIGMKTDLSTLVATAEFSRFADILSTALYYYLS